VGVEANKLCFESTAIIVAYPKVLACKKHISSSGLTVIQISIYISMPCLLPNSGCPLHTCQDLQCFRRKSTLGSILVSVRMRQGCKICTYDVNAEGRRSCIQELQSEESCLQPLPVHVGHNIVSSNTSV
jgi:hypothetical protein